MILGIWPSGLGGGGKIKDLGHMLLVGRGLGV
jgi:hypothetical protein